MLHFTAHAVLDSFLCNFVLVFNNLMRFKVVFYDLLFINLLALMKSVSRMRLAVPIDQSK